VRKVAASFLSDAADGVCRLAVPVLDDCGRGSADSVGRDGLGAIGGEVDVRGDAGGEHGHCSLVGCSVFEVPMGPVCDAAVVIVDKVDTFDVDEPAVAIVVILEVVVFVLCFASIPDVKRSIRIIVR